MFEIYTQQYRLEDYIVATYELESTLGLEWAAWQLAIGQSVGNPNVRNEWETDELFANHSCKILHDKEALRGMRKGKVRIAFPVANIDIKTDGISHLMCMLMGGQLDIAGIDSCELVDLQLPSAILDHLKGPKIGMSGMRHYTGVYDKPLLGAIIKPKIGVSAQVLGDMVKQLVDGGVNFIKEDEIMSNPACAPLQERLKVIVPIIEKTKIIYCYTVNSDPLHLMDRVKLVENMGGNGIHLNFWAGLGAYKSIRDLNTGLFLHYQSSGNKILTSKHHRFRIGHNVLCFLAALCGADSFHAGMIGGYGGYDEEETMLALYLFNKHNVVPALSCGMHPGLVESINHKIGVDWMANCGGAIHGHPGGTVAGAKAMRQAIDGTFGAEYDQAIAKWGKI